MEILIAVWAGWGFLEGSVLVLLACTFLMGLHSSLFGPAKFAYLPQHLDQRELTGGNALVGMGTFVAILLGNVAGGLLVAVPVTGARYAALASLATAVLGRVASHFIPRTPPPQPRLRIRWNPTETWRTLRRARQNPVVFRSLLGISWMWFFGAVFLGLFPGFSRAVLGGDVQVAALLLVVFTIGIGGGSLLCESLSRGKVEIGLVPLGALGMSVFSFDLGRVAADLLPTPPLGLGAFLVVPSHCRVLADLLLAALFTGLYSVPMYAPVQLRTAACRRSRIIAANNILIALFMVASAVLTGALLQAGLDIPGVFMLLGVANAIVALAFFLWCPNTCCALWRGWPRT